MDNNEKAEEKTKNWHFHRRLTDKTSSTYAEQNNSGQPHSGAGPFHLHRREGNSADHENKEEQEKKKSDDEGDENNKKDEKGKGTEKKISPAKKRLLIITAVVVGIILIICGIIYYLHARHYEDTDDAFIDGHASQVSSRIAGEVSTLLVIDNQQVEAGQLLLTIDPRDYEVRLLQAQAQLKQAQAQVILQQANIGQAQANVEVAEAQDFQAKRDMTRFATIDIKAITRQQRDNAIANAKSSAARLQSAKESVDAAEAQERVAEASVKQTDAEVKNAQLQLSYTNILAPVAGRVTRRSVELGNVVSPGIPLLAVVSNDLWVTANFKETQLTHMQFRQPVRIEIDAFPDANFSGHIESFQKGTGAAFSSLPAENATGNYVKVVQRVPVKIVFDDLKQRDRYPLALGMSVVPRVKVR